jgi:hypothetical protein
LSRLHPVNLVFCACHPVLLVKFIVRKGYFPNVAVPRTLAEKYLWRKVVDRNPLFVIFSDKLLTKRHMAERFPDIACAQVLWSGDDIRQAPRELLVQRPGFLKANHTSGHNFRLPVQIDLADLHAVTQRLLRKRRHRKHGEWAYRPVVPRLFIEEDLSGDEGVTDFTVYVFGETVSHFAVMRNHKSKHVQFARFDSSGRRLAIANLLKRESKQPLLPEDYQLPVAAEQICGAALRIAGGADHLRVDLLWNGQKLYLSEITVYSVGGFVDYADRDLIATMGESWTLRRSWLFAQPQKAWRRRYARWLARRI